MRCLGHEPITMANYLCNEYGLDTVTAGSTIAFAMECYEKGILDREKTGGVELLFGNGELVVGLIEKIARAARGRGPPGRRVQGPVGKAGAGVGSLCHAR